MFITRSECSERRGNHSLTPKRRFKNPKIHDLAYVLDFKTRDSCVHLSLIPGGFRKEI